MNTLHPTIKIKRVNPDAPMSQKAHQTDAAYDLCSTEDVVLRPGEWKMVGSGIATAIPAGYCGKVYPRSGLGSKGLVLKNTVGVIDSAYRGEIMLPLFNNNPQLLVVEEAPHAKRRFPRLYAWLCERYGSEPMCLIPNAEVIHVHKGDRVAQLCIELVPDTELVEVRELDDTDRGQGGFGSSGTKSITGGDRL